MSIASVFDFKFSPETAEEGYGVAAAIGADMPATAEYLDHEIMRDVADSGPVMVITRWGEQADAEAALGGYIHDSKVVRATKMAGAAPTGFLGKVADPRS